MIKHALISAHSGKPWQQNVTRNQDRKIITDNELLRPPVEDVKMKIFGALKHAIENMVI